MKLVAAGDWGCCRQDQGGEEQGGAAETGRHDRHAGRAGSRGICLHCQEEKAEVQEGKTGQVGVPLCRSRLASANIQAAYMPNGLCESLPIFLCISNSLGCSVHE